MTTCHFIHFPSFNRFWEHNKFPVLFLIQNASSKFFKLQPLLAFPFQNESITLINSEIITT